MADVSAAHSSARAETLGSVEPSIRHALPYFTPVAILLLVANAAMRGSWWLATPLVFFMLAELLDKLFGTEERNMDPTKRFDKRLFWYQVAMWMCVAMWPPTLVFALWQILVVGHLSIWEVLVMAVVLGNVATIILVAGHEVVHERTIWQRRVGEFILGSIGCAQYASEHVYVHHSLVATPHDPMSARKGQGFWQYLPWAVAGSILASWRTVRDRLALRRRSMWHYTNPFWRYALFNGGWFALACWMGGALGILVFLVQCTFAVFLLRLGDYVEHYGLTRMYLPSGRFERFRPWHSWNAVSKFSNWLYYNTQRHSDHHGKPTRFYPLLQNQGEDLAPRMPGGYAKVFNLALSPKRWFETMDPLIEQWRARFYPDVQDWSAYDSAAFAARPEAFNAIAEIHSSAPRLANWIDRFPELLDCLRLKEFTDLELPSGLEADPEFDRIARSGLARVYWTHEFGVPEMIERIADIPVEGVREAVEVIRNWSNEKAFQIGVHTMRGSLSPLEAAKALSNAAEASIVGTLSAVERNSAGRTAAGGVAAVLVGDLAAGDVAPNAELRIEFVCDGGPVERHKLACRKFRDALQTLSRDNMLFAPASASGGRNSVHSLAGLTEFLRDGSSSDLLDLTRSRCIFTAGDPGVAARFRRARGEILADRALRDTLAEMQSERPAGKIRPGSLAFDDVPGGARDVERAARMLQVAHPSLAGEQEAPTAISVFRTAYEQRLITEDTARHLAAAAETWLRVKGTLGLLLEPGAAAESAPASVRAVIARSCGADDFDALTTDCKEMAIRTAAEIGSLPVLGRPSPQ